MREWEKDLYIFRCATVPKERKTLQEYIELYLTENDEKYFEYFLHFYEPRINEKIFSAVQNYAMQGHFVDLKMVFVHGLYKALEKYDISQNVPFLIFAKYYYEHEIHEYIRSMRHGLTVPNNEEYKMLRKAMALYNEYGEKATEETIEKIAQQINRSPKFTCELLMAGLRNTLFIPFYKNYCDEEGEETLEDVTSDNTFNPEFEVIRNEQSEAVWSAYDNLDYDVQLMMADSLAFCPECHSIFEMQKNENGESERVRRKKKNYIEIALLNELAEPETVRLTLQKAYAKMREELKNSL